MKIYFVRHGETEYNRKRLFQGITDIPLNETGLGQAAIAKAWFGERHITFDRVYSSPLSRAFQTAEIISGLPQDQIIVEPRMIEFCFGRKEGVYFYDMPVGVRNLFTDPEHYEVPEDGETIDHLQERCQDFLDMLAQMPEKEPEIRSVLVAAHGAVFRGLFSCIRRSERKDFWVDGVPNCAVMTVIAENGSLCIESIDSPVRNALTITDEVEE